MHSGTAMQLSELAHMTRNEIYQRVEAYRIDKLEERTGVRCGTRHWNLLQGIAIQSDVVLREVIPQTFDNLMRSIGGMVNGPGGEQSALRNIREWRRFFEEDELDPWEIAVRELEAQRAGVSPLVHDGAPEGKPCPSGRHPQTAGCLCGVEESELDDVPYQKEPEDVAAIRLQLLQGGRR